MSLDVKPLGMPRKTTRILVYPNITFAKDITKDSFVQYLYTVIRHLNTLRDDLFFTIWMPEPVASLDFPNTKQVLWPLPTHAPAMRVHFDVEAAKKRLSHHEDIDLVWSHLPEATHALYATMMNLTHHRPKFFGYAHWFDVAQTATWDGASFRENISGILHMDRCYLNTDAQKRLVIAEAANTFSAAVCARLDQTLVAQALGVPSELIVDAPIHETAKVIVYNHRPDPYKDFPAFLKAMRDLRTQRQDFTVWIPLLDTAPEPWIVTDKADKATYYQRLRECRVAVAPKQTYAGWSLSATDAMMNGCPVIFYDADYYKELHPTADTFTDWRAANALLNRYLDDPTYRNTRAAEALVQARNLSTEQRVAAMSHYITHLITTLPSRDSATTLQLIDMIRQNGVMSKSEIMKNLSWGRGIAWTPYRRALLQHPNIFDTAGADPRYQWV